MQKDKKNTEFMLQKYVHIILKEHICSVWGKKRNYCPLIRVRLADLIKYKVNDQLLPTLMGIHLHFQFFNPKYDPTCGGCH